MIRFACLRGLCADKLLLKRSGTTEKHKPSRSTSWSSDTALNTKHRKIRHKQNIEKMLVKWAALCMSCTKHLWGPGRVRREGSMWYALKNIIVIRCIKKLKNGSTDKPFSAVSYCLNVWLWDCLNVLFKLHVYKIISSFAFLFNFKWFLGVVSGTPWDIYCQVKDSDSGETKHKQQGERAMSFKLLRWAYSHMTSRERD